MICPKRRIRTIAPSRAGRRSRGSARFLGLARVTVSSNRRSIRSDNEEGLPMFRALWVDEGEDLNVDRVKPFRPSFTRVYFSRRSVRDPSYLNIFRRQGFKVGLYDVSSWY